MDATQVLFKKRGRLLTKAKKKRGKLYEDLLVKSKIEKYLSESVFLPTCEVQDTIVGEVEFVGNGVNLIDTIMKRQENSDLQLTPVTENGLQFIMVPFFFIN